jgi:putative transcriptional regulator
MAEKRRTFHFKTATTASETHVRAAAHVQILYLNEVFIACSPYLIEASWPQCSPSSKRPPSSVAPPQGGRRREMSKLGDDLIQSMEEAASFAKGKADAKAYRVHVPKTIDVAAIRRKLRLSQAEFAASFGFSVQSIRNWEQGTRQPEGPARVLLTIIDRAPEAVRKALAAV